MIYYGWIDGIRRKLDTHRTMQLISPRKVMYWTKSYKDRAARLINEGRMQASGLESIELSKKQGLGQYMDDVDNLEVTDDLSQELLRYHGALDFFSSINPSSKRFVLRWIKLAKTNNTRLKRIKKIAQLASEHKKLPGS